MIALAPCLSTLLAAALASRAAAQPTAAFEPPAIRPGDPVVLHARGFESAPHAQLAGRALEFHPNGRGAWRAIAAIPLEQPAGELAVQVRSEDAGGAARATRDEIAVAAAVAAATLEVVEPNFRETRLTVPPRFVEPRPPEVEERVAADRAAFLLAFDQTPTPPLFSAPFRLPRRAPILGRFGDLRTFNGDVEGQHYGTDLKGRVGDPVLAANDGRVTLVRDAWASGLSVVVFHGAGLHTVYFHLSEALVKEGDAVKRGQRIGRVGASGRSTGPHLHWGVRIGDLYVDPEAVLRLKLQARPTRRPQPTAARRS